MTPNKQWTKGRGWSQQQKPHGIINTGNYVLLPPRGHTEKDIQRWNHYMALKIEYWSVRSVKPLSSDDMENKNRQKISVVHFVLCILYILVEVGVAMWFFVC